MVTITMGNCEAERLARYIQALRRVAESHQMSEVPTKAEIRLDCCRSRSADIDLDYLLTEMRGRRR